MKERPILFGAPMVRAILDGTKTQTRRVVNPRGPWTMGELPSGTAWPYHSLTEDPEEQPVRCPYGVPGDRLWVRETFALHHAWDEYRPTAGGQRSKSVWCRVDAAEHVVDGRGRWRPSIHMPRWASRITLEVTAVRVERLHDITEEDARAEGVEKCVWTTGDRWSDYSPPEREGVRGTAHSARQSFFSLWESITGTASLAANPWVWVISFRRVT